MAQRGKPADLQRVPGFERRLREVVLRRGDWTADVSDIEAALSAISELREELFKLMSLPPGDECPVCGGEM